MLTKRLALAVVAGTALLAASGAYARDDHYRGYGPRHYSHHHFRHAPQRVVVAPYYYDYAPQPVYYAPPPVYYAPPRPVIYGTLPIGDARVRIGLQF
ncbi:MAG: hypothetical protein ABI654_12185 [Betaproteobacteria bacterium]